VIDCNNISLFCYTYSMIIIVDAYNLLRAVPPYNKTTTDQERARFIAQLSGYGRRKGHKIVIIFDGGPHEWPFKENMKTVQVVYSGIHQSADDYIKEYIEANRAKDLLLVSSDSELNHFAARYAVPSIDSATFHHLLQEDVRMKTGVSKRVADVVVKFNHDNSVDIDALMMEASKTVPTKSEDFARGSIDRDSKKSTLSKQERSLLKKLNKL